MYMFLDIPGNIRLSSTDLAVAVYIAYLQPQKISISYQNTLAMIYFLLLVVTNTSAIVNTLI